MLRFTTPVSSRLSAPTVAARLPVRPVRAVFDQASAAAKPLTFDEKVIEGLKSTFDAGEVARVRERRGALSSTTLICAHPFFHLR